MVVIHLCYPYFFIKEVSMNKINLTSPIPISVNHYLKATTRTVYVNGKPKPIAVVYETKEAKEYKSKFSAYVADQVKKQGYDLPLDKYQHFYADCVFYFDRTDDDPNNYFKILFDAITLTQLIWVDDNVACERVQRVYYDKENPRIELTIHPVEYIGIFNNRNHLNEFEDRCKSCNRYSRNCSLLKNAIVGRIQKEINCGVCSKYKEKKDKTYAKQKNIS